MNKTQIRNVTYILILLVFNSCDDGIDGLTSLIKLTNEPPGTNCLKGGYKIETGVDRNGNGILDAGEIQQTEFICNGETGANGFSSLINIIEEPQGTNCPNGGYKIEAGLDLNGNNLLDQEEVGQINFICHGTSGINGQNSLIKFTSEPLGINCDSGGYKVEVGADTNNNGILDQLEVQQTVFICNGEKGTTIDQIRFKVFNGVGSSSSTPFIHKGDLIKFDIRNYTEIDSVIFVVEGAKTSDSNSDIIFELYDLTNNTVIINSEIKTVNTSKTRISSGNILSNLPQSEIDLGLRIRSEIDGVSGDAEGVYIFLYNRN